jgi:RecA-family ATPase
MPVAKAIRQRFPEAGIILAADDDYRRVNPQTGLLENIGLIKANKAAAAIGARLAVPTWQEHRAEKATDFNDLAVAEGPGAVRRCIEAAEHVEPLPEEEPEPGQDQETPGQDQETPAEKDDPAFRPICARELLRNPAPPRRWIVEDFIPAGQVTLFAGDGGTGKSTVAMQLALAAATGTSWLEMPVEPVRVLVLSAEDDRDEMHWRLAKMIKAIPGDRDENLEALAGRLWLLDATGALDPTLAKWDSKTGNFSVTDTYERICHFVASHDIGLVILDSAADIFAEENDRHAVRTLIRTLKQLGCTVLLLGHPSVDGMKSNRGYSGSTHWNNAVRSRLYFTRPTDSGGNVIDLDLRRLVVSKANRSRLGAEIILRWTEGGFVRNEDAAAGSDDLARQLRAEEVFLNLLKRFCEEGRPPSPNRSPSFAPKQFAEHPDSEGISKALFKRAMSRLLSAGKIEIVQSGTKSRKYQRLKVKEVA